MRQNYWVKSTDTSIMPWLLMTIFSYLIYALTSLLDKFLLSGPIKNPKVYAFYVGALGIVIVLVVPFVGLSLPSFGWIALALLSGIFGIYGLFWFYCGLRDFEASRVVPVVGGIMPLATLVLVFIFSKGREMLSFFGFLALLLLIFGSVLINYERGKASFKSLKVSFLAAILLALSSVLSKYVYLSQPFLSGLVWISFGGLSAGLSFFVFDREVRRDVFSQSRLLFAAVHTMRRRKIKTPRPQIITTLIFIGNQGLSAFGGLLKNWAIFLSPVAYVPIINGLNGIQYAFLLLLVFLVSLKKPEILTEAVFGKALAQKIVAILLISAGLMLLAFSQKIQI